MIFVFFFYVGTQYALYSEIYRRCARTSPFSWYNTRTSVGTTTGRFAYPNSPSTGRCSSTWSLNVCPTWRRSSGTSPQTCRTRCGTRCRSCSAAAAVETRGWRVKTSPWPSGARTSVAGCPMCRTPVCPSESDFRPRDSPSTSTAGVRPCGPGPVRPRGSVSAGRTA